MITEHIDAQLPDAITDRHDFRGDQTIVIGAASLLPVVDLLHREGFQFLVDITAVDWPEREPRFDVVYHWLNMASQERLRVKVPVADGASVPTLALQFKTANWFEREVFDLFGISFSGHPDLRRLLMWQDFPGHPLRKDFPLDGGDAFCMEGCTAPYNNGERRG
ncbi:MAG: NADH-quinone oxidoreductase subunit C [Holophagaceae bacterium]